MFFPIPRIKEQKIISQEGLDNRMRSKFDEQLNVLNQKLIQMGQAIEKNIQDAIDALVNGNVEKANQIIVADDEIDKMQREIENICFGLLIQQQPVAKDLRLITAAMKMVTDMERIGDHAVDISEMTEFLSVHKMNDKFHTLKSMASEATVMLILSIDAFTEKNSEIARDVIDHDDVVDSLFVNVKDELIKLIAYSPEDGEAGLDMLMIAKYLERIGDHATNIAEWVLYSLDDKR